MFNTNGDGSFPEVFLRPRETVHVPFKFQTFQADHSVPEQVNHSTLIALWRHSRTCYRIWLWNQLEEADWLKLIEGTWLEETDWRKSIDGSWLEEADWRKRSGEADWRKLIEGSWLEEVDWRKMIEGSWLEEVDWRKMIGGSWLEEADWRKLIEGRDRRKLIGGSWLREADWRKMIGGRWLEKDDWRKLNPEWRNGQSCNKTVRTWCEKSHFTQASNYDGWSVELSVHPPFPQFRVFPTQIIYLYVVLLSCCCRATVIFCRVTVLLLSCYCRLLSCYCHLAMLQYCRAAVVFCRATVMPLSSFVVLLSCYCRLLPCYYHATVVFCCATVVQQDWLLSTLKINYPLYIMHSFCEEKNSKELTASTANSHPQGPSLPLKDQSYTYLKSKMSDHNRLQPRKVKVSVWQHTRSCVGSDMTVLCSDEKLSRRCQWLFDPMSQC